MHEQRNSFTTELSGQVVHLNSGHTDRLLLLVAKSDAHFPQQYQWYHCRGHNLKSIYKHSDSIRNPWNSNRTQIAGILQHEQGRLWFGMCVHRNRCFQALKITPNTLAWLVDVWVKDSFCILVTTCMNRKTVISPWQRPKGGNCDIKVYVYEKCVLNTWKVYLNRIFALQTGPNCPPDGEAAIVAVACQT